jgi:uncharacterized delta-60 repeat protein
LPSSGYISALRALPDGKLLVSGITFYRINADGSRDATFNPGSSGFNSGSAVLDIELTPDNKILIGGSFNSYNGISRSKIALLLSDGTLDTTFEPAANFAYVNDLAIQPNGKIIVAGKTAITPRPPYLSESLA